MSSSTFTGECFCCCEPFNKKNNKLITCVNKDCDYNVCKECAINYILSSNIDAHCMNCKTIWSKTYLVKQFSMTWVNKVYDKSRTEILYQKELSRIPETVFIAEKTQKINNIENEIKNIRKIINTLCDQILQYDTIISEYEIKIEQNMGSIGDNEILEKKRNTLLEKQNELLTNRLQLNTLTTELIKLKGKSSSNYGYNIPCPTEDCRGFVDELYKCGICNNKICENCYQSLSDNNDNNIHICDKNIVENIKLLEKDTRSCPSCKIPIHKIEGCDQMWCVKCHIAFSWRTGNIEKGIVHNPHYYQWKKNNDEITRNPGDHVCGGIPRIKNKNLVLGQLMMILALKKCEYYYNIRYENVDHDDIYNREIIFVNKYCLEDNLDWWIETRKRVINIDLNIKAINTLGGEYQSDLDNKRRFINENDNKLQEIRIDYIIKKIETVEKFKSILKSHYNMYNFNNEIIQLEEMFVACVIEFLNEQNENAKKLENLISLSGCINQGKWVALLTEYNLNSLILHDINNNKYLKECTDITIENYDYIKNEFENWLNITEKSIENIRNLADYCKQYITIYSYVYQLNFSGMKTLGKNDELFHGFLSYKNTPIYVDITKEEWKNILEDRKVSFFDIKNELFKKLNNDTNNDIINNKFVNNYLYCIVKKVCQYTIPEYLYPLHNIKRHKKSSFIEYKDACKNIENNY